MRAALALLEGLHRRLALLALADFERCALVRPELFQPIAGLQRPAWGSWNGLLKALGKARRAVLREGTAAERERLAGARFLASLMEWLDSPLPAETVAALRPLGALTRHRLHKRRCRLRRALAMPIVLRNLVAHLHPRDRDWWAEAAAALAPWLDFLLTCEESLATPEEVPRAPWFRRSDDGWLVFAGLTADLAVTYVSRAGTPVHDETVRGALQESLERLLGRARVRDESFKRWLTRLAPEELQGVLLEDFLVGAPVGTGGFATVHRAQQLSTGRRVAMKLLHDGLEERAGERFRQEAEFLSHFRHPHIVGVYAQGESPWQAPGGALARLLSGEEWFARFRRQASVRRYIALEWIDGVSLEQLFRAWYRDEPCDLPEACTTPAQAPLSAWFEQTAEALAAVHAAGLLHRDVKPGNIMIGRDGVLKLMDFGIARSQHESRTLQTATGQTLGTPAYMSPEQLEGRSASEIGPASDCYGLCATFYELYTGRRLFDHDQDESSRQRSSDRKRDGERPSLPRPQARRLPWELRTLLLGGLEPEARDRPASLRQLADDLRALRAHLPIRYRQPGWARRAELGYRRNRRLWNLVAVFLLLIAAGVIFTIHSLEAERARTAEERDDALRNLGQAYRYAAVSSLASDPQAAQLFAVEALAREERPETWKIWREARAACPALEVVLDHGALVSSVDFHPDGTRLLTACFDGRARIWELPSRRLLRVLESGADVACARYSPDGSRIVTAGDDGARLWDADSGERLRAFHHEHLVCNAELSADGRRLVTTGFDGDVTLWDVASGARLRIFPHRGFVPAARLSADGARLLTGSSARGIQLWDVGNGEQLARDSSGDPILDVAFLGDAVVAAFGQFNNLSSGRAEVWEPATGSRRVLEHDDQVSAVAVDPAGTRIATASHDGFARLWDAASGALLASLDHGSRVTAVRFGAQGRRLATADWDGAVRIYRLDGAGGPLAHGPGVYVGGVAAWGDLALTGGTDGEARLWDLRSRTLLRRFRCGADVNDVAFDGAGRLATGDDDGWAKIWQTGNAEAPVAQLLHDSAVRAVCFSRDGRRLLTGTGDGALCLWELAEPDAPRLRIALGELVHHVAFAPGERAALVAVQDGTAQLWDLETQTCRLRLEHGGQVVGAALSSDGARVYTSSTAGSVKIWDGASGAPLAELPRGGPLHGLALSPDGSRLAVGAADGRIHVLPVGAEPGEPVVVAHGAGVWRVGFAEDGRTLLVAAADGGFQWPDWSLPWATAEQLSRIETGCRIAAFERVVEPRLRLAGALRAALGEDPRRANARALPGSTSPPDRAELEALTSAILDADDPARAWLECSARVESLPRPNAYRLLLLEALEPRAAPVLALVLAAERAAAVADRPGTLRVDERWEAWQEVRRQLEALAAHDHPLVGLLRARQPAGPAPALDIPEQHWNRALHVGRVATAKDRAIQLYLVAHRLMAEARLEPAEVALDQAIAAHERAPAFLFRQRGRVREGLGDLAGARRDYDEALRRDPASARTYVLRGELSEREGAVDAAWKDFAAAVEQNPCSGYVRVCRARLLERRGEHERALEECEEALRLEPTNGLYLAARGRVRYGLGAFPEALRDFDAALLTVREPWIHFYRALLHERRGHHAAALADCDAAIALRAGIADYHALRAELHLQLGDPAAALADLDSAIALEPADERFRARRARLLAE